MGDLAKGAKSLCPFETADPFGEEAVVEKFQPAFPEPLRLYGLVNSNNVGRISGRRGKVYSGE